MPNAGAYCSFFLLILYLVFWYLERFSFLFLRFEMEVWGLGRCWGVHYIPIGVFGGWISWREREEGRWPDG